MKKLLVIILCIVCVHAIDLAGCSLASNDAVEQVKGYVGNDIRRFHGYISDSLVPAATAKYDAYELRARFLRARLLYKQFEWAAEYFMPVTSRFVNGPPLPEVENEENKVFEPEGLQVIEALIYNVDSIGYEQLQRYARLLAARALNYKNYWDAVEIDSSQICDALKLQVFRIVTLGISGFDAPLAKSSFKECEASLRPVRHFAGMMYGDAQLDGLFAQAIQFITSDVDFDKFDRLRFIKEYCDPLTRQLVKLQQQHHISFVSNRRLLRSSATSLFAEDAFDVNAYTSDSTAFVSQEKIAFGKKLFSDPMLSLNGRISCSSCHDPAKGFADGLQKNVSLHNTKLSRNTPTLLHAALQPWQFYDMRTTNLENQSRDVIESKDEMHGSLAAAVARLKNEQEYTRLYHDAFAGGRPMEEWHIQNAIASYIRSLSPLNSRFDRFMRNEKDAMLTDEERKGFNLFMGKAKCGTCHFAPLFNGTVPPAFIKMESEVIGVPADKNGTRLDTDPGRYALFSLEPYQRAFKTTTVRNAALTAPYMHNGVFETLEEVVDFYDKGGGIGLSLDVPNQTLPPDKLNLAQDEKNALIAFLKTLTASY